MTPYSTIFLWHFNSLKQLRWTIDQVINGSSIYDFLYDRFKFKKMPNSNLKLMAELYLGQNIPFGIGGRYTDDTFYIALEGITSIHRPCKFLNDLMYSVFLHECGHVLKTNKKDDKGFTFSLESEFVADEFLFDLRGKPAVDRLLNDTIRRIQYDMKIDGKDRPVDIDYKYSLDLANKRKEHIASLHRRPTHKI